MRNGKQTAILFGTLLATAPLASYAVVVGPTPVALSGTAAPAGGNYLNFSTGPKLNAAGQVAFQANTSVSGQGIFAGTPGSLAVAALQGTAAPSGGNYTGGYGGPVLNAAGQVVFFANVGPNAIGASFFGTPGSPLTTVILQGDPSSNGGIYTSPGTPTLNPSGQIAVHSTTRIGSNPSQDGIFAGTPGSTLTVAAIEGTPAPGGGNYSDIGNIPVFSPAGQVAFRAATRISGTDRYGIFTGTPGSTLTRVALEFTPAPAGGNYTSLSFSPVINASGQVAFRAATTSGSAIFAGTPGLPLTTVALDGTAAPAGGNYDFMNLPAINASGHVAFRSPLTGGTSDVGIFAGAPGSLQTIALQGGPIPSGVGNFSSLDSILAFNAPGQVAFLAGIAGPGVGTSNDIGLYVGTPDYLFKVVREGDILDVDPGVGIDVRTVSAISFTTTSSGEDGRAMTFNDSGLLVYRLTFTDNSSGIFTSVIPEPASLSLLALASTATLRRHRR